MKEYIELTAQDRADIKARAKSILDDPALLLPLEGIVELFSNSALYMEMSLDLATRINLAEEIIKEVAKGMNVKITYPEPPEESLYDWSERLIKQIKVLPGYPKSLDDLKKSPK